MSESSAALGAMMDMGPPPSIDNPMFDRSATNVTGKKANHRKSSIATSDAGSHPQFPPPKTDKPRPHVCTTCMRSFARLEHLKRHERSHTKEKPFECPECTRCFARRDLLLRHQQKLHSTTTPSSRPRQGRRESVAGVAAGRVRKNSVASNANSTVRPRANTLSHVDANTLGMLANTNGSSRRSFGPSHGHHNSVNGFPHMAANSYHGMAAHNNMSLSGLPKLETHGLSADIAGGLRIAPPFGGFGAEFGTDSFYGDFHSASTINPSALHMHGMQGLGIDQSASPFQQIFPGMSASQMLSEEDSSFDWIAQGFESQMSFAQANENAIDDSSPSAMSTNSPAAFSESYQNGNIPRPMAPMANEFMNWQPHLHNQTHMVNSPLSMDVCSNMGDMVSAPADTVSPKSLLAQHGASFEINMPTPSDVMSGDGGVSNGAVYANFNAPYNRHGTASTVSTGSIDSSLRLSSVTTLSSDFVTEQIRSNVIAGLSQNSGFGQRKQSQPSISSPLNSTPNARTRSMNLSAFPSTQDLQRFVQAYIKYQHSHLPFLHIPSLHFDSPEYTTPVRNHLSQPLTGQSNFAGGGSCLVLSMAAIGALFENDMTLSRELFEYAKRLISAYLEERRKSNMSKTQLGPRHAVEREDTPLWLVQAMLLNVVYGHNCGDKTAADIASNHCAALVSLARGAELAKPYSVSHGGSAMAGSSTVMTQTQGQNMANWGGNVQELDESDWLEWKIMEERKRTLYAIFIVSSMLVTGYNHAPTLTNSEIRLDLPCDEELWAADSAQLWRAMGGSALAEAKAVSFATALTHLLTAAQRERQRSQHSDVSQLVHNTLHPSSFGCFILINSLHNYIWETRQRHLGRQWTSQEIEAMHAHIEPALRAWQAAWASDPSHSLERPNPFGAGPLSADSIPLLDLAYIRLFVNFGPSKEAFWDRDFDAMAHELAKGSDMRQSQVPAVGSRGSTVQPSTTGTEPTMSASPDEEQNPDSVETEEHNEFDQTSLRSQTSRRERHLRKAAFYAADSFSMSEQLVWNGAENLARDLPTQSAMCAFDCAQVLGEWVTSVQERIGKYVGVLGRDDIDLLQVPAALLLEDEDRNLINRIDEILVASEHKIGSINGSLPHSDAGYGNRILMITVHMLNRGIWPVYGVMAKSLETQATFLRERALASVML